MSAPNDGGPAFPVHETPESTDTPGMSLRDYFAAKAMQAQCITDMVPGEACEALCRAARVNGQDPIYRLALNSYAIADAMLKARAT